MRGHFLPFVVGFAVAAHTAVGCSSNPEHAPFASNACTTPPCSTPSLVSGGGPIGSGGSAGLLDAGTIVDAAAQGCFVEPTSGLTLCATTAGCNPGLDRTLFPSCGFIPSSTGLDLECICQQAPVSTTSPTTVVGPQVCPIIAMAATCAAVQSAIVNTGSQDTICNSPPTATMNTSNCRDPNSIVQSGAGGTANCPAACSQQCAGSLDPSCMTLCCSNTP